MRGFYYVYHCRSAAACEAIVVYGVYLAKKLRQVLPRLRRGMPSRWYCRHTEELIDDTVAMEVQLAVASDERFSDSGGEWPAVPSGGGWYR